MMSRKLLIILIMAVGIDSYPIFIKELDINKLLSQRLP